MKALKVSYEEILNQKEYEAALKEWEKEFKKFSKKYLNDD